MVAQHNMAEPKNCFVQEEPCVESRITFQYDGGNNETNDERSEEEMYLEYLDQDEPIKTSSKLNNENPDDVFAEKFAVLFYKVTGKDEVLDAYELQMVMKRIHANELETFHGKTFSLETCRCMVSSIDKNRRGYLNFDQFKRLWFQIMYWKNLFEDCDLNNDDKIDFQELQIAAGKLGFTLKDETLQLLINRYVNRSGTLNLDDFCGICSKLVALKQNFDDMSNSEKELTYDRYLIGCLYT